MISNIQIKRNPEFCSFGSNDFFLFQGEKKDMLGNSSITSITCHKVVIGNDSLTNSFWPSVIFFFFLLFLSWPSLRVCREAGRFTVSVFKTLLSAGFLIFKAACIQCDPTPSTPHAGE